jgi:hypothetical protein
VTPDPRQLLDRALAAIAAGDVDVRPGDVPGTAVFRAGGVTGTLAEGDTAPAPARSHRAPAVDLEPYVAWEPRDVPDPRSAGRDALGLYTRASGGRKLTTAAKAPLTGSAWRLKVQGRLEIGREGAVTIEDDDVLRVAGGAPVRVRELGPRTLEEVPLDEVAALMRLLREAGAHDLKRAVLDAYGLVRLTTRADQYLERALAAASA